MVTVFYNYVGQLVPQKEVHPPEAVEVSSDMTTEEMVEAGGKIVNAKCMTCHSVQPRFPTLDGVGARAATQKEGFDDVAYLAESLYEPNEFIVSTFAAGMTAANKPPLLLSDKEILTVLAYLQSLGGTPTVTMNTKLKYQSEDGGEAEATKPAATAAAVGAEELTPVAMITKYGCLGCHNMDAPVKMLGPSLYDVGKRLDKGAMYEALVDPDATVGEGFVPGIMSATLNGNGFATDMNGKKLKLLVLGMLKPSSSGTHMEEDREKKRASDGPFKSASRTPTRRPILRNEKAAWSVIVLFPTPPFPEPISKIFLHNERRSLTRPRCSRTCFRT